MRVITGIARNRKLLAPSGTDTRPTADLVKEAVFSIIQFEVEGARVLDLFAGSGQIGIEALSRGAVSCVFVDNTRVCRDIIAKNLTATKLSGGEAVCADAVSYLKNCTRRFDVIFMDPPYDSGMFATLLPLATKLLADGGIILCESTSKETMPTTGIPLHREYRYGKRKISLFRSVDESAGDESGI